MYFQHVVTVSLGNTRLIVSMIEKLIYLSSHSSSREIIISLFFFYFLLLKSQKHLILLKRGKKSTESQPGLHDELGHLEQTCLRGLWKHVQVGALNGLYFPVGYSAFQIKSCFLLLKLKSAKHWTCFVRHTSREKIFRYNDMTWRFKADNKWHLVNATNLLFPLLYLCVAVGYHILLIMGLC